MGLGAFRIATFTVLISALPAGCLLSEIDQTGRSCPCADGWECTEAGCLLCARDEEGTFRAEGFQGDWATPASIRWRWTPSGREAEFGSYEIVLANSAQEICGGRGDRYDASTNPELGRFSLPRVGGENIVQGSIIRGLDSRVSEEVYWARLTVTDNVGGRWQSPLASFHTLDSPGAVAEAMVLFEDDPLHEFTTPDCMTPVADAALSRTGSSHLLMEVVCPSVDDEPIVSCDPPTAVRHDLCIMPIRLGALDVVRAESGTESFRAAYLEFEVSVEQAEPVWYAEVGIDGGNAGEVGAPFDFQPLTIPGSTGYELFQIPLDALVPRAFIGTIEDPNTPRLSGWDQLGASIVSFRLFGRWSDGGRVRLDSIRIVW